MQFAQLELSCVCVQKFEWDYIIAINLKVELATTDQGEVASLIAARDLGV